jgi:hypothetical protein
MSWPEPAMNVALELRRLCDGDLAGMFDGQTTVEVDWTARWSSSTSRRKMPDDEGLAILMACATA